MHLTSSWVHRGKKEGQDCSEPRPFYESHQLFNFRS